MFKQTKELVMTSTLAAIILVLSFVPQLGFITLLPGVSITIVHIPVLIGIMMLSLKQSLVLGVTFGMGSWIASLMYAASPVDLAFQNPLISILPRVLFALVAWGIHSFLTKNIKVLGRTTSLVIVMVALLISTISLVLLLFDVKVLSFVIASIVFLIYAYFILKTFQKHPSEHLLPLSIWLSTLIHTALVLTTLVLVEPSLFNLTFGDAVRVIYGVIVSNGLIEAMVAVLITVPVIHALKRVMQS
jgi:uncharacterized membrane protein